MTKTEFILSAVFLAALFAMVVGGLLHNAKLGDEMMEGFSDEPGSDEARTNREIEAEWESFLGGGK